MQYFTARTFTVLEIMTGLWKFTCGTPSVHHTYSLGHDPSFLSFCSISFVLSDRFVFSSSFAVQIQMLFFHPHKSRLFVVLIGIIRATHIQTKNKQIDGKRKWRTKEDEKIQHRCYTTYSLFQWNALPPYGSPPAPAHAHTSRSEGNRERKNGKAVNKQQQHHHHHRQQHH